MAVCTRYAGGSNRAVVDAGAQLVRCTDGSGGPETTGVRDVVAHRDVGIFERRTSLSHTRARSSSSVPWSLFSRAASSHFPQADGVKSSSGSPSCYRFSALVRTTNGRAHAVDAFSCVARKLKEQIWTRKSRPMASIGGLRMPANACGPLSLGVAGVASGRYPRWC